jgi:hydrogenase maturation factor
MNDAQTSGGLLLSLPGSQADSLIQRLSRSEKKAVSIGNVIKQQDKKILVN